MQAGHFDLFIEISLTCVVFTGIFLHYEKAKIIHLISICKQNSFQTVSIIIQVDSNRMNIENMNNYNTHNTLKQAVFGK